LRDFFSNAKISLALTVLGVHGFNDNND
jgi:hypothetical protein